ncbi:MAG: cation transporter [Oscillospiraceae bacterium]|nr:cation transporter [Oscillospiraceae bacterium]
MTSLLIKIFVHDSENVKDTRVRAAYGTLGSVTGIIVNLLLAAAKGLAGILSGSISVAADALNNLSDALSSVIALLGVKFSAKPADREHPYGHGRIEYISALAVSFLILLMAFELFKSSVQKIINPSPVIFSVISAAILTVSILCKLWLGLFYGKLAKKTDSETMKAVMKDSFCDCLATSAALAAVIFGQRADGYLGILVACFILVSGIGILKETMNKLLGKPPEKEFVEKIENKILSYDGITGVHDLIIHDYGSGRLFASAHAELSADSALADAHDIIDLIEREIKKEYGMLLSIHPDPIAVGDKRTDELRLLTENIVNDISTGMSIHDFRVIDGPTNTNLIFDLMIPYELNLDDEEICRSVEDELSKIDERYFAAITPRHFFN